MTAAVDDYGEIARRLRQSNRGNTGSGAAVPETPPRGHAVHAPGTQPHPAGKNVLRSVAGDPSVAADAEEHYMWGIV